MCTLGPYVLPAVLNHIAQFLSYFSTSICHEHLKLINEISIFLHLQSPSKTFGARSSSIPVKSAYFSLLKPKSLK